jgi:hypothetical protein
MNQIIDCFFLRTISLICVKITAWKVFEEFTETDLEEISLVVVVFFLGWNVNMKWESDEFIKDREMKKIKVICWIFLWKKNLFWKFQSKEKDIPLIVINELKRIKWVFLFYWEKFIWIRTNKICRHKKFWKKI